MIRNRLKPSICLFNVVLKSASASGGALKENL